MSHLAAYLPNIDDDDDYEYEHESNEPYKLTRENFEEIEDEPEDLDDKYLDENDEYDDEVNDAYKLIHSNSKEMQDLPKDMSDALKTLSKGKVIKWESRIRGLW